MDDSNFRCGATRDEAARIGQTLRRLLAQREVEAEFIVVDDRSADGTGDIVRESAKDDARVQLKRVEVLPDGWLGKCHACHVGASVATGNSTVVTLRSGGIRWRETFYLLAALRAGKRFLTHFNTRVC